MQRKPVVDISEANPKLFAVVQELVEVQELRCNIILMKKYLTVCRIASDEKLLLHLVSRQHFVDGPNLYSIQDLMDINNGSLLPFLHGSTQFLRDISSNVFCVKPKVLSVKSANKTQFCFHLKRKLLCVHSVKVLFIDIVSKNFKTVAKSVLDV